MGCRPCVACCDLGQHLAHLWRSILNNVGTARCAHCPGMQIRLADAPFYCQLCQFGNKYCKGFLFGNEHSSSCEQIRDAHSCCEKRCDACMLVVTLCEYCHGLLAMLEDSVRITEDSVTIHCKIQLAGHVSVRIHCMSRPAQTMRIHCKIVHYICRCSPVWPRVRQQRRLLGDQSLPQTAWI